ncbi:T9SS type A sorting domain-containing protein [Flavobacterium sp. M31R6]|uniref:T9SS type A sorting domain-containing protein n=1 Tax=Flavobacterium sp. M31R6 TaxID=2739062 RepID=UPI0015698395|nr:T9SS type A sorting domain-containing protein [Flavobacterium sp. M31R6]QKJ61915.1 T9SS type A sorting domain-containing protein [Flavobacterium sp. M31R6]
MKTKLLLFLTLFSLIINAQNNLVPNGDFENWTSSSQPDNWFRYFSGFVSQSTSAQNGLSSTNMMIADGTFNYINSEYFPVVANKTYRITLYHKLVSGSFSAIDLSLYHKPGAFKEEIIKKTDATFSNSEWRQVEFDYTPAVSENIEVDIWTTGTLNSEILVDNVSVIDVATIGAQYTLIPDVNFENKLISLGIDSGVTDGKVLTSNINTLTSLNVSNSSISDLTGIQDFVALQSLDCQKNNLTSLDLSKNGNLIEVNCTTNKLTNFINTSNLGLTHLYCSSNQLTSLDVTKYIALTNLYFSSNKITSIDVSSNNLLVKLWCNSNLLTELNITNNTSLIELNCATNQLTNLNVTKNTALTKLYCYYNQITSLDVTQNIQLEWFMCHFNQLTSIDISNNPKLDLFDCLNNKITSLDISKNPLITELACENNQLTYLNLKNGANTILDLTYSNFVNNPNLKCIQVDDVNYSNANWTSIKDANATYNIDCTAYTLIPDVNFENKLIALGIDSGVADGKVPTANVDKLTSLDVSLSSISNLTGIQDFTSLKELICTANYLTTLDISKNSALLSLQCNVNKLSALDLSKNLSLESLKCSHNHITSLDVSNNLSLTTLMCDTNQLTDLDVSKNLALSVLIFDYNKLTTIDVSKNKSLNTLGFSFNNLTGIDVSNNNNLGFLNCQSNQFTDLDISHNLQLGTLYCNDNQITSLDVSKNGSLGYLFCQNNKLLDLNLKNGNQTHFANNYLNFTGNPKLTCIQVDDAIYSNANWSSIKDDTANFNTDCSTSNLYTYISDVKFENKLISLGIDSGVADGKVLTANVDKLTSLDVSSNSISDLTGIQDFVALTNLNCSQNELTTLNTSKNLALISLECSNNKLSTLDVSKNLSLESLRCSANNITSLDISNNLSLETLACNTNQLSDLDVSKNLLLIELFFDYNKISSIDVSKNSKLGALTFSSNNITTIDVSKNSSLGFLNCQSNQLTNLDLSHNLILNSLFCNDNQITSLDISKNNSVVFLLCQNNKLLNLNLKNNGNKALFDTRFLNFTGNPNLTCIQVDNIAYSNTNWANLKDITANYSTDCNLVYTLIPNSSFEQKLIDLGIDTDGLNGKISTTSIESITSLDLSNTNIKDLTGIENFTALKYFTANGTNLTSVDFSKNLMLQYVSISGNNLTSLDVSKNTNLSELDFSNNKVMQIDLSQNKELTVLNALGNQLTTLDISQNPKIKSLNVEFNQLTSLNLQNGNNANFVLAKPTNKISQTVVYTSFSNNPNLSCIKVDNVAYSNQNWSQIKDATATYSSTCSKLGIEDSVFDKVAIFPNPTKGELHIDNIVLEKVTVYDALGKLIKTTTFTSGAKDHTIHLEGLPRGIYYIYLESEGANTAKKVIVK